MSATAISLLTLAGMSAIANWIAVARGSTTAEYVTKPLTMVFLVGVALTIDPTDPAQRAWFVVALVFSLAGDVFLMLPSDMFLAGLASFLLAHVAYTVGFIATGDLDRTRLAVAAVAILAFEAVVVGHMARVMRRAPETQPFVVPIVIYALVIGAMVVTAIGSGNGWAIAGAVLFMASDLIIGWNRFVKTLPAAGVVIMVTYHLGQAGLVVSLAS